MSARAQDEPPRESVESILLRVDQAIDSSAQYEQRRLDAIELLRHQQSGMLDTDMRSYSLNNSLFREYESLICDSAIYYLNRNIDLTRRLGRGDRMYDTLISKALVNAKAGLFLEAFDILRSIDVHRLNNEQKVAYYLCYNDLYQFLIEYERGASEYTDNYRQLANAYKDSVLMYVVPESFDDISTRGSRYMDDMRFQEGIDYLLKYLPKYKPGMRERSILSSVIAYGYRMLGDEYNELVYYADAAISDIQGVVKENMAMRALAEVVDRMGDYSRANRYINKSIEDANYYMARMRNGQSTLLLPLMTRNYQASREEQQRNYEAAREEQQRAYVAERDKQQNRLVVSLIVAGVLALLFVVACVFILRQLVVVKASHRIVSDSKQELSDMNERLTKANNAFRETNERLSESTLIREEYIARFLQLCSSNLSTLEQYRRQLNQLAASGKNEELYRVLKSQKIVNDSLDRFYETFDTAFLNIFPDFVERFNMLLLPDSKIELHTGERLNTELRIFALIRLGISDSATIAELLRLSITTIYTYRSKTRARAIDPDTFEQQILNIHNAKSIQ